MSRKGRRKERIWNFPGTYGNRGNGVQRVSSDATESFVSPAYSIRTVGASIARPPVLSAAFHGCAMHAPAAAKNGSEKPSNRETRRQTATRRPAVSACQKSPCWTFLTASTAEHFDYIKMLLRSKSLDVHGFSAAGYWNARRVLTPSRTPAALSSAREATFFDSLGRQTANRRPAVCFSVQHGITTIIYKNLDYLKTLYYDIAEITPAEW